MWSAVPKSRTPADGRPGNCSVSFEIIAPLAAARLGGLERPPSPTQTKRYSMQVTALAWNPQYPDFFAAAYGSYDFMRQGSGIVCCFSLKNTSHPEYTFGTESGVSGSLRYCTMLGRRGGGGIIHPLRARPEGPWRVLRFREALPYRPSRGGDEGKVAGFAAR